MRKRLRLACGLAVTAALLVTTSTAQASVICVSATLASCEATIADAIAAAAAGDTIALRRGVYYENVVIPPALTGLKITGTAGSILDPGDDGLNPAPNTGVGIAIQADDVTLRGFKIRNGDTDQVTLAAGVTGTTLTGIHSLNAEESLLTSLAAGNDGTTVERCVVHAPNDGLAVISGDDVVVRGNRLSASSSDGIDITGANAVVSGNTLRSVENGDAISVSGANAEVVRNRITAVDDAGINVSGANPMVVGNDIRGSYDGIDVSGDSPIVKRNRLQGIVSGGTAVDVFCTVCTDGEVSFNRVSDVGDDTEGFSISAAGAGLEVANNRATDVIDTGFYLSTVNGAMIRGNRASYIGGDEEDCFDLNGDDNTLTGNFGSYCMGDGFQIDGLNNTLTRNSSMHAGENGFEIEVTSVGTTLTSNRATGNGLAGFEVQDGGAPADQTTLERNQARDNLADLCDEGTNTTLTSNRFGTTLAVVQDGTRDCPQF